MMLPELLARRGLCFISSSMPVSLGSFRTLALAAPLQQHHGPGSAPAQLSSRKNQPSRPLKVGPDAKARRRGLDGALKMRLRA